MIHTLAERLRSWAQNEEMIDGHFLGHGKDCNAAADRLDGIAKAIGEWRDADTFVDGDPADLRLIELVDDIVRGVRDP